MPMQSPIRSPMGKLVSLRAWHILSVGAHFERTTLGEPIDNILFDTVLRHKVSLENPPRSRCSLRSSLSQCPLVFWNDVEALTYEQDLYTGILFIPDFFLPRLYKLFDPV
jgi:hypothetical protein